MAQHVEIPGSDLPRLKNSLIELMLAILQSDSNGAGTVRHALAIAEQQHFRLTLVKNRESRAAS